MSTTMMVLETCKSRNFGPIRDIFFCFSPTESRDQPEDVLSAMEEGSHESKHKSEVEDPYVLSMTY